MKTFIAPAPARVPRRGRLYVARDVLPASRAAFAFAFAVSARAEEWIHIRTATARGPALQLRPFARGTLLAQPPTRYHPSGYGTPAHTHRDSGTRRRDGPIPG